MYAECDITQIMEVDGEHLIFRHTTGMLGVPGNISLCTLLHGIFIVYILGSQRKGRCVGDDGKMYTRLARALVIEHLQKFGRVAAEKVESWERGSYDDTETWAYTKRPISRLPLNRVVTGHLVTFPTLDTLCNLEDDGYHRFLPEQETAVKRKTRLIRQYNRLLVQLWSLSLQLSELDRILLYTFQKTVLDACRGYGNKGRCQTSDILFRLPQEEFGENPRWKYIESLPLDEEVELPEVNDCPPEYFGYEGEKFVGVKTKLLRLMEKLGYCQTKMCMAKYSRRVCGDRFFYDMISGQFPACYEYVVIRDFPYWAFSI
jgi:hypothetical protein